jgi:hypothetical protein
MKVINGERIDLKAAARKLKTTLPKGFEPLVPSIDSVYKVKTYPGQTVNERNVEAVWNTFLKVRLDDGGELDEVREDLADFRLWMQDASFIRAIDEDPQTALAWFVDVLEQMAERDEAEEG